MMLAELLSSVRPAAGSDAALTRAAALQVTDALACLSAGVTTDEGRALLRFHGSDRAGEGPSPSGVGAVIRMTEYDAIHVPSCLTPAIVAPVALALAPDLDICVRALEAATGVGLWMAEAVGGISALERGVWPTLFAAPAMAAVTAGVCLRLSEEELEHATALALAGTSGRLGRPSGMPSGRWLAIGEAIGKGVRAAHAASAGFRGDPTLVSTGWLQAQGAAACPPVPCATGRALHAIGLKPYVAARQGMNAIAGFRELVAELEPESIERVVVELPPVCLPVVKRPLARADRLSRVANLALRIGVAATAPDRLCDVDATLRADDPALAVAERVEIAADPMLEKGSVPSWPARVSVRAAGREWQTICQRLAGDAGDIAAGEALLAGKIAGLANAGFIGDDTAAGLGMLHGTMREGRENALAQARRIMTALTEGTSRSGRARVNAPGLLAQRV